MMVARLGVVSVLIFLLSLQAAAQSGGQNTRTDDPAIVSGRVIDLTSGEPIGGAYIFTDSTPVAIRDSRVRAANSADELLVSATDESGNFELRNVKSGLRSIRAVLLLKNVHSSAIFVNAEAGKATTGVTIRMARPATISGVVTNEDGKPLAGVRVSVVATEFSSGRPRFFLKSQVRTNRDGYYELKDLVPANRKIRLLADWLPLRGAAFSDTRTPVAPADREPAYRSSFYMGDSDPESGLSLNLKSGEHLEHIDFRLQPQPSLCAIGKIQADPEVGKVLLRLDPDRLTFGMSKHGASFGWGLAGDLTGNSQFRVCGLVSGDYSLIAHSDLYGGGAEKLSAFGNFKFTVGNRDLEGLELRLTSPRSLKVVVECEDNCRKDQELGSLHVSLLPTARSWLAGESSSASLPIPGNIVLPKILSDEYSILVKLPNGDPTTIDSPFNVKPQSNVAKVPLYVKRIQFGTADLRYQSFHLDSQFPDEPIRIIVSPQAASLTVRVEDDKGKPVSNYPVFLMPKDATTEPQLAERLMHCESDADGLCHFAGNLPPGEYKVVAAQLNVDFSPEFIRALWTLRDRASELDLKPSMSQNISVRTIN